jgi:hypothetical protein
MSKSYPNLTHQNLVIPTSISKKRDSSPLKKIKRNASDMKVKQSRDMPLFASEFYSVPSFSTKKSEARKSKYDANLANQ